MAEEEFAMMSRTEVRLLNAKQCAAKLGIARSTLYAKVRLGLFVEGKHYLVLPGGIKRYFSDLGVYAPATVPQQEITKKLRGNSVPQASLLALPKGARIRL